MNRTARMATHASRSTPSRLQVVLAAAWMILSLAIGGAITAESRAEASSSPPSTAVTGTTAQP